jgi:hypothetical protein
VAIRAWMFCPLGLVFFLMHILFMNPNENHKIATT